MISHDSRAIFVHIPKTAGTSIEVAFGQAKMIGNKVKSHPETKHNTLEEMKELYPDEHRTYYTFSVVRNPWEREYSLWKFLNKEYYRKKRMNFIFDFFRKGKERGVYHTFKEYLNNLDKDIDFYLKENITKWDKLFRDQVEYILVDGNIELNRIIRFEGLEAGYKRVCEEIGRNYQPLPKAFWTDPGQHLEAYDQECIDLVSKIRKKDIEFLNYSF